MRQALRAADFPGDFLWGAATSAYQIEGFPLADGAGPSNWHEFTQAKGLGHVALDHDGKDACQHYRRFREDVRLMAELGLNAYRFSIAWSRILPQGFGAVNPQGLDFYRRLVGTLREHGIQPMATLYHWDLPAAIAREGGWQNPRSVDWFRDYAEVVLRALAPEVPYWCTLNEPWVVMNMGYVEGTHPPAAHDWRRAPGVAAHLLQAHAAAVEVYRSLGTGQIGLVVNLGPCHPASSSAADQEAARRADAYLNRQFLEPAMRGTSPSELRDMFGDAWIDPFPEGPPPRMDFVGVNYYMRSVVRAADLPPTRSEGVYRADRPHTAMGWEIYPPGLFETLMGIREAYGDIPIMITENGAAFDDPPDADGEFRDDDRIAYLADHLTEAHRALRAGVPLRGYFVWSLLDNFEWTFGYTRRFGLVHVDFVTQRRTVKHSGRFYQALITGK